MATSKSAKIQTEIEKVKAKITEQQARLKELEQKKMEAENTEIVDIIYTPWETRLMREAKEMGAAAVNGFDMLFYQGLASFEIWNDMKVEPEKSLELKKKLTEFYRGRA